MKKFICSEQTNQKLMKLIHLVLIDLNQERNYVMAL